MVADIIDYENDDWKFSHAKELLASPLVSVLPSDDNAYPGHLTLRVGKVPFEFFKYNPRACSRTESMKGLWPLLAIKHELDLVWKQPWHPWPRIINEGKYFYISPNVNFAEIYGEYLGLFRVWPFVEVRMPSDYVRERIGFSGPILLFNPTKQPTISCISSALRVKELSQGSQGKRKRKMPHP